MNDRQLFLSFCEHLGGLLKAELPLRDALVVLSESAGCGKKQAALSRSIFDFMKKGYSFSSAVSVNGVIHVDERICSLIAAAERAGNLCEMLSFVTSSESESRAFTSKILGACVYPLFVVVFSACACLFLLQHSSLLGFKRIPDGAYSGFLISLIFITLFSGLFFWAVRRKTSENPQLLFFNSLSFFLSSGFDLKRALSLVSIAAGLKNASLCSVLLKKLSLGIPFSKALQEEGACSAEAMALVCLAEKSGRLREACETVASLIREEDREGRQNFLRYGEPLLLAAVGIYVLILAQNVVLPFITNFDYLL
ncbi:MAG: type II secretion system F family protein [Treponemataceae bacterium]|nr:type II secretion system F family protein [Treponemataceae bacterium]